MVVDHRRGVEVIDGDVEEALDLGGVQVHGQHAVGPGAGDDVGHQLGRDGHAAFVLAVLPGVAEVGNHGRDAIGAGPLQALDHDQQFHQVFVDRRAGGLEDEDVAAANVLVDLAGDFAVGEIAHHRPAQGQSQVVAHASGQFRMGTSAEEFHVVHNTLRGGGSRRPWPKSRNGLGLPGLLARILPSKRRGLTRGAPGVFFAFPAPLLVG